jgi:uncharacterized membrane protein (DUF4010 family)
MPSYLEIVYNGAMVLLMGLLIGLEREHSQREEESLFAGVRTFPLIALTGFLSALVARAGYDWVLAVALAGVCALAVASYITTAQGLHRGATTEFVALLAFILGALTALDYLLAAATFAVATALILALKAPLHELAKKIQRDEMFAVVKFGVVSVIILPLLPNRAYGPFEVLNPRLIWWLVVLISAVSMVGYVLMRLWGARGGISVTGFLGGLASSTAATVGLSQQARQTGVAGRYFALGIVIAWTIMFARVLFLTSVVEPRMAKLLVIPIALPIVLGAVLALMLARQKESGVDVRLDIRNPMELGKAVQFALIFGVVLFVSRASHHYFGSAGIYLASGLAGLADVDAITVSAARLARDEVVTVATGGAAVLLACAVNTLVKGLIAILIGGATLRRHLLPIFAAMSVVTLGGALFLAWK